MTLHDLSRYPPRSLAGRLLRIPLKLVPRSRVTTVRSGLNRGAKWRMGAGTHGCWLGAYEHAKQRLVREIVEPGWVAWDVGANAGFYTLGLSRLVGLTGRVVAFEPLAENIADLLSHVRLNRLRNVTVVQAALYSRIDLAEFESGANRYTGHIVEQTTGCLVPCLTADAFLARRPEAAPDLLKIDVEGSEGAVLHGARKLLQNRGPRILLALHGMRQSVLCRQVLSACGYQWRRLDGSPCDLNSGWESEIDAFRS